MVSWSPSHCCCIWTWVLPWGFFEVVLPYRWLLGCTLLSCASRCLVAGRVQSVDSMWMVCLYLMWFYLGCQILLSNGLGVPRRSSRCSRSWWGPLLDIWWIGRWLWRGIGSPWRQVEVLWCWRGCVQTFVWVVVRSPRNRVLCGGVFWLVGTICRIWPNSWCLLQCPSRRISQSWVWL